MDYPNVKYAPGADYAGIDDFVVAVKDADGRQSNPAWIAVEVGMSVSTVHRAGGDWSIFRPKDLICRHGAIRKHGPVPFPPPSRKSLPWQDQARESTSARGLS